MTHFYEADQLPTTSEAAIRIFEERYLAVSSAAPAPSWATDFGPVIPSASPDMTFPLGFLQTKYRLFSGTATFKSMIEKSIRVYTEEFQAGYEAKLLDITQNVFAYKQWEKVPERFMIAEARFRNLQIAALLEAGHTTSYVPDGQNFFDDAHLSNPSDASSTTWDNYQATTKDCTDIADLSGEITAMRDVRDENGDKLGVEPDTILVPTAKFQGVINLLKQDLIASSAGTATVRNPYFNPTNAKQKGLLQVIHVPELTDVDDFFLLDSAMMGSMGLDPWGSIRHVVPANLGLRIFDESSDFFKESGKLKIDSRVHYGFSLLFPHAIRMVKGK